MQAHDMTVTMLDIVCMGLHVQPSIAPILYITPPGPMCHFAKTWVSLTTYLRAAPPCTYCQNLSSKFHHITAKQPSNSLRFLHYKLVTEHSFKIAGKFFLYPVVLRAY